MQGEGQKGLIMHVLALDGHPAVGSYCSELLSRYCAGAERAGARVTRFALRDVAFDPILHEGYRRRQVWEPELRLVAEALQDCHHFVVAFPLWWGGQPALLKGFFDRVLLPGVAFAYHEDNPFWDRLLSGRSAEVLISGDTPKLYLRVMYGAPVLRQMSGQVLGFCGFRPVRQHYFAPIRNQREAKLLRWLERAERLGARAARRSVRLNEREAGFPERRPSQCGRALGRPRPE
jgi:NAD(P)H dehydrogenase (quinone)